jgi:hypothetical protein
VKRSVSKSPSDVTSVGEGASDDRLCRRRYQTRRKIIAKSKKRTAAITPPIIAGVTATDKAGESEGSRRVSVAFIDWESKTAGEGAIGLECRWPSEAEKPTEGSKHDRLKMWPCEPEKSRVGQSPFRADLARDDENGKFGEGLMAEECVCRNDGNIGDDGLKTGERMRSGEAEKLDDRRKRGDGVNKSDGMNGFSHTNVWR